MKTLHTLFGGAANKINAHFGASDHMGMNNITKPYTKGTVITIIAIVLGLLIQHQSAIAVPAWIYSIITICAFTIGTIGRIGWDPQTWKGKSKPEILDARIFLTLYFIGVISGVAAIKLQNN